MIPQERVTHFVEQHRDYNQTLQLSFFEMTVGLAFDYFASEQVDVAVVEVGMGGRLDSTNVITPDLCIITNIGFDHTQFLGDTLPKIAVEKAGIIKQHVPVVIGETLFETKPVFEQRAAELQAPIYFADDHYRIIPIDEPSPSSDTLAFPNLKFSILNSQFSTFNSQFTCPLTGSYQLKNLATLFQALELLPTVGYNIAEQHVRDGIARVVEDTGLHGRWEKMDEKPLTICETAHNADGVAAMLHKLSEIPYHHLHIIYGCVNDKDFRSILRMLPHERTTYYYSQPSVPRALPVDQLAAAAADLGMVGETFTQVAGAISAARHAADVQRDLVLVTGSIFLVADAIALYHSADKG